MIVRKILLVAHRELWENVRGKGFWIGILAVPVLIVASVLVPILLQKAKDARAYAVIDESGWLLERIEVRARYEDANRLLSLLRREAEKGEASLAALPGILRDLAPAVSGATDAQVAALARILAGAEADVAEPEGPPPASGAVDLSRSRRADFVEWYGLLSSSVARSIDPRLMPAQFRRVAKDTMSEAELKAMLDRGPRELFAYFVIGADPVAGSEGSKYVSNNRTDQDLRQTFARLGTDSVRTARFATEGVAPNVAVRIQKPLVFEEKQVGSEGEETKVATADKVRQWTPMGFTYILWFSVFVSSQMLLTNTIEEKSNRLMEVLLSSTSPLELMVGKTLGTAATGLTVVGSWALFALGSATLIPRMMGAKPGSGLSGLFDDPAYLLAFVGYYVLGFLLYSAVFVAVGSLCDNLKDAQSLMQPLMIVLIIPLLALMPVTQDPNGTVARVLSFIPPFTPFVMMNRAAGPPETWEYAATLGLLVVSIVVAFYLAAKIFRVGVLMTGTPPRPMQILRMLRAPVGTVAERKG